MKYHSRSLAGFVITAALFPFVALALEAGAVNHPPLAEPITATLNPPVTTYAVVAEDPDGDPLTYSWESEISCGLFKRTTTPSATWSHPNGDPPFNCPHDAGTSHPGRVYVAISDGKETTVCSYDGSEPGSGLPCTVSMVAPAGTYKSNWAWWDDVMDDYDDFLYEICYFMWPLLLLGGGWLCWYLYQNGLFVNQKKEETDPCTKERAEEEAARERYEAAKAAFASLDAAKSAVSEAERRSHDANHAAADAARAAGGRWSAHGSTDWEGDHIEVHKEGWQNKELGQKADDASAAAKAAKDAFDKAKKDLDAQGGDAAWQKAKSDMESAKAAWEKSANALKVCVGGIGVPPATPTPVPIPPATPSIPTDGGGDGTKPAGGSTVSSTPGSTTGSTPPPEKKKEEPQFVCIDGETRNETSESVTVEILDLQSVRMMQDRIYSDAGNEAMKFVDYLQTIKDLFNLGKQVKGGVEGYLTTSLTGAADAVNFPDFLTWYDVGVDQLTKSMHQLYVIMQDKQRLGDYWLEYDVKRLTLTCTRREVCAGNKWAKHCALTIEDLGMVHHRTEPEQVFEAREVQRAITRLFTKLRNRYRGDQDRTKRFTEACSKCL